MNKIRAILEKHQLLVGLITIAASILWSGSNFRYSAAVFPGAIAKFDQRTGDIT